MITFTFLSGLLVVMVTALMWRILDKAGYHGAWSLVSIIPLGLLFLLAYLALYPWPIERKMEEQRRMSGIVRS